MHKKFEINRTKIKGSCQSGRKVVTNNSKSDLPLIKVAPDYRATKLCWHAKRSGLGGGGDMKSLGWASQKITMDIIGPCSMTRKLS